MYMYTLADKSLDAAAVEIEGLFFSGPVDYCLS